jgi:hypothetical protein
MEHTETANASVFRYVGYSYMTFYGPSGRKYRFGRHGQEIAVDPRDRDFVKDVPNVREIKRGA